MPDTLADFNPSDISVLSAEQRSTFAETLVKAGFDRASIEQKLGPASNPVVPAVQDAQPASSQHMLFNVPDDALTPDQKLQAAETLRRAGVSEQTVQAALNGQSLETTGPTPADYKLNYGARAGRVGIEELSALNTDITKGFSAGGILPHEAQPLLDAMLGAMDLYGGSANEEFVHANEASTLSHLSNSDEIVRTARIAYNALPADFRETMNKRHAFDSASAYLALSRVGQMMEYRGKNKI